MAKFQFQRGNKYGKGRPKGSGHVDICKKWAETKGWQRLMDWAEGKGHKIGMKDGRVVELGPDEELQFQATKLLIEYGVGKPSQAVELSGSDGEPMKINLISYARNNGS